MTITDFFLWAISILFSGAGATWLITWAVKVVKAFIAASNLIKAKQQELQEANEAVDAKQKELQDAFEKLNQTLIETAKQSDARMNVLQHDLNNAEQRADRAEQRADRLERELDTLQAAHQSAQAQITQLSLEINRRDSRIAELEKLKAGLLSRIAELERQSTGKDNQHV